MPIFTPWTDDTPPPVVGAAYERAIHDYKGGIAKTQPFHLAKDVASFANHLGGTIVVGVSQEDAMISNVRRLPPEELAAAQDALSQAVRDRCAPQPIIDFARPSGLLAVNVWPMLGQVVGVKVAADKEREGYGDDAWVFPVRTGTDSIYLLPEQLAMFIQPEVRRVLTLLSRIQDAPVVVMGGGVSPVPGNVIEIAELKNTFTLRIAAGVTGRAEQLESYPIDGVETVWQKPDGKWWIRLRRSD